MNTITPVSFREFSTDFEGFAQALGDSFARFGFAIISDHDLDQTRVDAANAATKAFFALPDEVKKAYVTGTGGQRGYTPFGIETAKNAEHFDLKEFWHMGRDLPAGHRLEALMPRNVWPEEVPSFHPDVARLYANLDDLGRQVLRAIAHYLGRNREFFEDKVNEGNSVLRLLHYPPVPAEGPNIRAGAHEDINVITLLLGAEEAGLEVMDRDGRWLAINPPAGSVVCNIGDMLQRLTNHVLPSTTHRVVNPVPERRGLPRYSTPFFLHFNTDFEIETLADCVSDDRPLLYPHSISAHDFLQERLREIKLI